MCYNNALQRLNLSSLFKMAYFQLFFVDRLSKNRHVGSIPITRSTPQKPIRNRCRGVAGDEL
jgi:hypothetical protein